MLFAASAGMLAAFNPCGFALLPSYLALFLGTRSTRESVVARALLVGAAVTAGFVGVFGIMGLLLALFSVSLGPWLGWVTLVSGAVLVGVGGWLLSGRDLAIGRIRVPLPVNGTWPGMVAYGVVYATISLSCTLPVFVAAVLGSVGTPGSSPLAAVAAAGSYALGMGVVLTTLALVVGLAGQAAIGGMQAVAHRINRISGAFVLVAGLYVTWYGWVEVQSTRGETVAGGPVLWVAEASGQVSAALAQAGPLAVLLASAGLFAATAIGGALLARRRR
ncbi:MAG: cytochrome c biogenesis protein CcdA [Propionibacteriaceae bacterium]|nr:cytochrome c biogenesis protein CcdA [Propionibacteriaceae bacterium]